MSEKWTYPITDYELRQVYPDEETARQAIERIRWPDGPVCPHCGATRIGIQQRNAVVGYYRCHSCQCTFTVRTSTLFQRSHVPLQTWLRAMFLIEHFFIYLRITSLHLSVELGISQKAALFLLKRYRTANSHGKGSDNQIVPKDLIACILDEACGGAQSRIRLV